MKKVFLKLLTGALLINGAASFAQPTLAPMAAYTNNPNNYAGVALYKFTNWYGNQSGRPYDVAVTSSYHFHSGVSMFNGMGDRWVLCKKNATTGAPIAMVNHDIAGLAGLANSGSTCNGMLLDETNNRIYLFGSIAGRAVIACYNLSSLAIQTTFGTNGVQVLSNVVSDVTDAVLTFDGNFAVLLNEKDVNNKNFISIIGITPAGAWMGYDQFINAGYECYGKRFRKYSFSGMSNTYYIAGWAVNTSSQSIPMIWEVKAGGIAPLVFSISKKTSDSFTSPALGYGIFVDLDFMPFQIIAVGNNSNLTPNNQGIWAKYNIPVSGTSLTPISTFKNGATLPGIAPVYNYFTRCLVDPDGYTIVASYNTEPGMSDCGRLGYINTTGTSYVIKYDFKTVHKVTGLMKDYNGNIIAGGCDVSKGGISTGKFTSYAGSWGGTVNKQQAPSAIDEQAGIAFNTFPNPASNALTLSFNGIEDGNINIQVMDMSGKKVRELTESAGIAQALTIDISELPKGSYFVRLTANEKSVMKKIVKQ